MLEFSDLPKFFLAFFLVLPLVSLVHEGGHVFFAWLMGGRNIKVSIGTGKVLSHLGLLEIRQYYFWYGLCSFDNIKRNRRFSNILIFSGGVLFNALSAIVLIYLIEHKFLKPSQLTYQFIYFSLYYIFFALLPMPYPGGNFSDGKVILDLLRNRQLPPGENTWWVKWDARREKWVVQGTDEDYQPTFSKRTEALQHAREEARKNRPSRIMQQFKGEEQEIENYPRLPL